MVYVIDFFAARTQIFFNNVQNARTDFERLNIIRRIKDNQAYFTPIPSALICLCMCDHMQLKLVKAASPRLTQYFPPWLYPSIDEIQSNYADVDLICDSGGLITINKEFHYLGTIISSVLRDRPDIDRRINQASKSFGLLCYTIFCNKNQFSPIIRCHLLNFQ